MTSILKVDQLQDSGGNSIITKNGSNLTVEVEANNDASLGVARNKLIFHDTDTAIATGQSAGAIEWKQDGGTLGAGTVGKIECITEGTGGSYTMTFSNGNASGSGGTQFAEHMRVNSAGDLKINSGYGSVATAYGIRAWVHFNGNGTVGIQQSGNVSSITDHGTGDYTINFTNAMPDTNYAVSFMAGNAGATSYGRATQYNAVKTTTGFRVHTVLVDGTPGSYVDDAVITYTVVR